MPALFPASRGTRKSLQPPGAEESTQERFGQDAEGEGGQGNVTRLAATRPGPLRTQGQGPALPALWAKSLPLWGVSGACCVLRHVPMSHVLGHRRDTQRKTVTPLRKVDLE